MYDRGRPIPDEGLEKSKYTFTKQAVGMDQIDIHKKYCDTYREWIQSTQLNNIIGLDDFRFATFSMGTTESFDKFYVRHKDRQVKVLKGEYSYHHHATDIEYIEDSPLTEQDCVIISLPFADSGMEWQYHETMKRCTTLGIPVLVDCCWFGTCAGVTLDFSYPCIEDVVFALSKTFPVNKLRIGCRFSKRNNDGLSIYSEHGYLNFFTMNIGLQFIEKYDPDFIWRMYHLRQEHFCETNRVIPSAVVSLALGTDEKWEYLNRGGPFNRLCIADELAKYKYC
jgi:hypothetical protein